MQAPRLFRSISYILFVGLTVSLHVSAQNEPTQAIGSSEAPTTPNPVPLINQPLVPDTAKPGSAGFTLTANGTGFVPASVVKWNGNARTTTFVSSSQLKATVLAADVAAPSTALVSVVNPSPGGGESNVVYFQVITGPHLISVDRTDYPISPGPFAIATADLNQDGHLDVVVSNVNGNAMSVLLGNGDGTFQAPVDYATQNAPWSVAIADFNGDGKLDLAVANNTSNTLSILLGNGDGSFQPSVNYVTGGGPTSVAIGDFDGDGKLDLAVTNANGNSVSVLLGNGDGTFRGHVDYLTGMDPHFVAVGDFNGDGALDLVVANFGLTLNGTVSVLLGNGDGTFRPQMQFATGSSPNSLAIADFNGDENLDLAVANLNSGTISILLGKGDGTFQAHVDYPTGQGQIYPTIVSVGDLNGDGKMDLAVTNQVSSTASVLLGNGDGTFQPHIDYTITNTPDWMALADLNGDGKLDLIVASPGGDTLSVFLQGTTVLLSTTSLSFGTDLLGNSSNPKTVRLTNDGVLTLRISSITITGINASDFSQTNTCASSLSPGSQCTITVTFNPHQLGPRAASIVIADDGEGPNNISLSGTGVTSGPNANTSPASLSFSTQLVGTSGAGKTVTLANYGTAVLSISSITVNGDFSQSNNCGSTLAVLASCTITVVFKPTQSGSRSGILSLSDNASGSPQTVALTGVGTVVQLSPPTLNFGTVIVELSATLTTVVTNIGSTAINLNGITISGTSFSETNTCGSSLGAHKSCNVVVTFAPESPGTFNGTVSISDNGGGSPQQVSLSGIGKNPTCGQPCLYSCGSPGCVCFAHMCRPMGARHKLCDLLLDWAPAASFKCGGEN